MYMYKHAIITMHKFNYSLHAISVPWTPVSIIQIGSSDINSVATLNYTIPSTVVPDTAKAVLIYPTTRCGYSNADMGADLSYYVVVNGTRYEHFLHMHAYRQNAYNTNSDNMWFPMPPNRQLYVGIPQAFPNNCHTFVSIIGYR